LAKTSPKKGNAACDRIASPKLLTNITITLLP
jgi:hypothetical protein